MRTDPKSRQPAGIPVGGQFASRDRAESSVPLSLEYPGTLRNLRDLRDLRDLVSARAEEQEAAKFQWELANAAYVRQALLELHPGVVGAEFVCYYPNDSFRLRSVWDKNSEPIAFDEHTNTALSEALYNLAGKAASHLGDSQKTETEETVTMSVSQPILDSTDEARAIATTASRDAGLGEIMPAMLNVLIERGEPDIVETISVLDEDQITELYEDVVGVAADSLEESVRNIAKRNETTARELGYERKIMEEGR